MKKFLILALLILFQFCSFGQGRVVINEYLPWASSGCNTTTEFVELYNFGPGPVNIGCYILTEGDFSITIPSNTILQPGQYYLISGQDILPKGCGNLDSAVHVSLNWTTCNCTSGTIPTNNDGLFTDGGNGNEQVVLLDPNLNVVDALVRDPSATEASAFIQTSTLNGNCTSRSFDLDLINIPYETAVGQSTGRGNSFARIIDGDCKWIKESTQSANAPNYSLGDAASISYELTITNSMECNNSKGAISINVIATSYTDIFPMNYTLAYDADNNQLFSSSDQYTSGVDNTPSRIDINDLKAGNYRITLFTPQACNSKTFDFQILECSTVLPVHILSFKHLKTEDNKQSFSWAISEVESVRTILLEQSNHNSGFTTAFHQTIDDRSSGTQTFSAVIPASEARFFRLRITLKNGNVIYSGIISTHSSISVTASKLWPNPAKGSITIQPGTPLPSQLSYKIYNLQNSLVEQGDLHIGSNQYNFTLPVHHLSKGFYQVFIYSVDNFKPISLRFVKD
ncbi:lamin tail domain-containing protein [Chitinophagaceae bacterium LB-8]|uniref:Lamin tail domain-containing protein n=1 Tax=Paraflavisolibacter caeni TaxID=2982496 RepID=A0A9X3B6Z6_9BACT|nr:lamin tail domain-containing protein [Paraflavisolibacter caeni]MCU7547941.1 lamin tail domain-containing protein [Paraflavisolibacter caeni]